MRYLIFVRHGEAEALSKADATRHLTEKGREDVRRSFEVLKDYLKDKDFKIYSSPVTRAVESAEEGSKILGRDFKIISPLQGGTLDKVVMELEGEYNVLVSHQPFIGDWIYELTDKLIKVKKGSYHIVELHKEFGYRGKLIEL